MLERHFSATRLNEIINHPDIFPWIRGRDTNSLDLTLFAANKNNVCLVGEHGCVIFQQYLSGLFEYHTCVLPEGRGKWMLDGAKDAFRYMFTKTPAFELLTKTPDGNLASKAGARAVGCSQVFRTRPIWPVNDALVPVDVWSLVIQNWVKNCPEIAKTGELFHDKLQQKYEEIGKIETVHDEDVVHNQYVGATAEMILSGQINKAISFYNRFAIMASYRPIKVISYEPLVIDIFEEKLLIENGDFSIWNEGN